MRHLYLLFTAVVISAFMMFVSSCGGDSGNNSPGDGPDVPDITEINIDMVLVHGGTFIMGCTPEQGDPCIEGSFEATLDDYYIGKYEVTQGLWKQVMGDYNMSAYLEIRDDHPVENVSWNAAQGFIANLNEQTGKSYRLPTEAEWEFAARGGEQGQYKFPGSNNIDQVAWHKGSGINLPQPIGGKAPNGLGLYDMAGNVAEWIYDWDDVYTNEPQTNPTGPASGVSRGHRGGAWYYPENMCRISYRNMARPENKYDFLGFRLVHGSPM
ncbi:MAG: formylglycine-generating enzyme family protein [Chitinispirillia bacterium]|nr:formylglycine-generating enzyme family protein [Chitinispirillia bacterium]MCL2268381.1 formylglycine-generating enzyme family protein [Chitinispirillia bacterium]